MIKKIKYLKKILNKAIGRKKKKKNNNITYTIDDLYLQCTVGRLVGRLNV